VCPQHQRE
jgi:putative transposase